MAFIYVWIFPADEERTNLKGRCKRNDNVTATRQGFTSIAASYVKKLSFFESELLAFDKTRHSSPFSCTI
jgi:hypothetical protein